MASHRTNTTYLSVNTGDESYAPKSPDLSGTFDDFETEDTPHPQHQGYRGSVSHYGQYTPTTEPTRSPWGSVSQQGGLPYGQAHSYSHSHSQQHQLPHQIQAQPQYSPAPQNQWYARPPGQPHLVAKESMVKEEDQDYVPGGAASRGASSRASRVKTEEGGYAGFASASNGNVFSEIEVKTKFPIARIKRIMQADEDVGKVAQVTPVAVSKALELFMISLVTKAASQAKSRNSKRVLAAHLKEAIATDEQFDFLTDIVSKVADAPAANAKKEEADSDEAEVPNAGGKKKRAPRARKRKDSDEF